MKLTPKLALVFISFAFLILLGVGTLAYYRGRTALEAATYAELESSSVEKSAAIDNWVAERKADLTALSRSPALLAELGTFLAAGRNANSAHDRLVPELSVHTGSGQPYLAFFILSPDTGEILIATNPREEGRFREDRDYFIEGRSGTFVSRVYFSYELQGPAISASAPLRTSDGRLLGVLVGRLNLEELNTIVQRRSGLRQTDDAFLVNTSNLFVTQPHLLPDPAVLQRGIHTQAIKKCLQTHSAGTLSSLDYRNVPAIISYRWLPEHEMCLIVKVNQAEALTPIHAFGRAIAWIALLTLSLASGIALFLSHNMLRPILAMQTAAQAYGHGQLDIRLPGTRGDELGLLAHEFNQMAAALAEKELELRVYAQTLEQKVQERTRELAEAHFQLSRAEQLGRIGSWVWNIAENRVSWSDGLYTVFGLTPQEFGATYEALLERVHSEEREAVRRTIQKAIQTGSAFEFESRILLKGDELRHLYSKGEILFDQQNNPSQLIGVAIDITARKQAEEKIQRSEAMLRSVLDQMPSGVTVRDARMGSLILSNARGREIMGALVDSTNQFAEYRGFHPDGRQYEIEDWPLSRSIDTGEVVRAEEVTYERNDGIRIALSINSAPVRDPQGQIVMGVGVFDDVTERKDAEEELHRLLEELKYSNAELEQFAYVASHDLQEPLRMVSSYMQLLARRYEGKLDSDADEFISFAVDGAKRMQNLINDLLAYSRVGTRGRPLVSSSCEEALKEALANLQFAIEESGAIITHEPLPEVRGDPTQLVQLFQNLLSNAIKFRGLEAPRIHVDVHQDSTEWVFGVCDNGIGLDSKFAERIFVIFQRLHQRDAYPGTGIGLAICKRIIQRHGGRIWVESRPGEGATFYFTLPNKENT